MNMKNLSTKAISTAIVTLALALGAGFGTLANNDTPANANTPAVTSPTQDTPTCSLVCVKAGQGGGGSNLPSAPGTPGTR